MNEGMTVKTVADSGLPSSIKEAYAHTNVWQTLNAAGNEHLAQVRENLRFTAPEPGAKILIQARHLRTESSTMDSLLLSALDVCTHLQLARMYFVPSLAADIDFLEFLGRAFPFTIAGIVSHIPRVGGDHAGHEEHRLDLATHRFGITYRNEEPNGAEGLSSLEQYFFPESDGSPENLTDDKPARLAGFLFFHNNHRSLPTLGGHTPIQILRHFPAFRRIMVFDPK